MYKDPDKQREANRLIQAKRRSKGVTESGCDKQGVTEPKHSYIGAVPITPDTMVTKPEQGVTFNRDNLEVAIKAMSGQQTGVNSMIKPSPDLKPERTAQGNIRVSKPGDPDYVPQCETTRAFIEGRDKRPEVGKRGKDIKVFEDLPPDVQVIINSMSEVDGVIDQKAKAVRTEMAIMYQHHFPDRYYSAGVAMVAI